MSAFRKEFLFALAVVSLGVLFWQQTLSMNDSAAMLPRLLIVAIALLSVAMLIQAWRRGGEAPGSPINIPRVVAFLAFLLVYAICAEPVGYFVVTPIFIIVACRLLRAMTFWASLCTSIVFSLFIYALFVGFLHLPVPLGVLENLLGG